MNWRISQLKYNKNIVYDIIYASLKHNLWVKYSNS